MGGICLHKGAVAAEEIIEFAGPALLRAGAKGKVVGDQALAGGVLTVAVSAAVVALGQDAVPKVFLKVPQALRHAGLAEHEVRKTHHVVDGAVLLVAVAEARAHAVRRGPDLAEGLPAGGKGAAVRNRRIPVRKGDVAVLLLAGHLVDPGAA